MDGATDVAARQTVLTIVLLRLERQDSEVSPSTILPHKPTPPNARGEIAPWEDTPPSDAQLENHPGNLPSISRQPPSAHPMHSWNTDSNAQVPSVFSGGFFHNDSNENLGQISPGFTPGGGAMGFSGDGEDRRPSIASATTVSSTGSKASVKGRVHKKLQGFFGDEVSLPGVLQDATSRQNSEASLAPNGSGSLPPFAPGMGGMRDRNNSVPDGRNFSGPPSPSNSRPRTPVPVEPTSEITPWVFQDPGVCCSA